MSVPDMGYSVNDPLPRGEILLSGPTICQGYWEMPEKTQEDFIKHSDGKVWFHTGDIGLMTKIGTLQVIDRKKDLVKLSGGEYVSLGKVEAAMKQVPGVLAAVVFARPDKDHCVAIVSQPEKGWAAVGGRPVESAVLHDTGEILKGMNFARFEIPTKVKIDD